MNLADFFIPDKRQIKRGNVGLQNGVTGVPIMLTLGHGALIQEPTELSSAQELGAIFADRDSLLNRLAYQFASAFFHCGGRRLIVFPINVPVVGTSLLPQAIFDAVIGYEKSLSDRAGLERLKSFESIADLVICPQAAVFLDPLMLQSLYQRMSAFIDRHPLLFGLFDLPNLTVEALGEWVNGLECGDAMAVHPWVTFESLGLVPPSVLLSAFMQTNDERFSISEPVANKPLAGSFLLASGLAHHEVRLLNQARINVIRSYKRGEWVLWGHSTLARTPMPVSTSRTIKLVREALIRLCEPFVLELLSESTLEDLKLMLSDFLQEQIKQGVICRQAGTELGYVLETRLTDPRATQKNFVIDVSFSIENPEHRIGFVY